MIKNTGEILPVSEYHTGKKKKKGGGIENVE